MTVLCELENKTIILQMALRLAAEVPKFSISGTRKQISLFSIQKYLKKYVAGFKNIDF